MVMSTSGFVAVFSGITQVNCKVTGTVRFFRLGIVLRWLTPKRGLKRATPMPLATATFARSESCTKKKIGIEAAVPKGSPRALIERVGVMSSDPHESKVKRKSPERSRKNGSSEWSG